MALTERTRHYETLIRHNPDGTVNAHHVRITELLRDGVVINATLLLPESLDSAGLKDVVGAAFLQATKQIAAHQVQIGDLGGQLGKAREDLDRAKQDMGMVRTDLENARKELGAATADLVKERARADDLAATIGRSESNPRV